MKRIFAATLLVWTLTVSIGHAQGSFPFEGCGQLKAGVEAGCVLFEIAGGTSFLIYETGGFQVGDSVYVSGTVDPTCISICMQGMGCIYPDYIESCDTNIDECGVLVPSIECPLFETESGTIHIISYAGGFNAGDTVRVRGAYNYNCPQGCMTGGYCLVVSSISSCETVNDWYGELVQGTSCILFMTADSAKYVLTNELLLPHTNFYGASAGDSIHIRGNLAFTFVSICGEEDAALITECFTGCDCLGLRGNVDGDFNGDITITDITFLVAYLFQGGLSPQNLDEADVDGSGGNPAITITDITYLVDYLFRSGPPPPACP